MAVTSGAAATTSGDPLDGAAIRADFPLLAERKVHGKRIVYLDSAGSSQKPRSVLDAMDTYYRTTHANVHRGVYAIAEEATAWMEAVRAKTARFVGAASDREVIFTKNATEALNLVAQSWGRANLGAGDAVLLTQMEHHSNIVPWQMLAAEKGFEIRWIPVTDDGRLDLTDLDRLLDGVKAVGLTAMSNVLGTITPVREITDAAHAAGAIVSLDACQYVPHVAADVAALGVDFAAFSSHKMLGPTGVGILWGREDLLDAMPPFLGGGGMILDVNLEGFTPDGLPWKFEAGTPPIAEIIGLGAAIDYLEGLGMDRVRQHEVALTAYALRTLTERFGDELTIHGPVEPAMRGGVLSFSLKDLHPHDVAQVLDQAAICVRPGHHCAKPLMKVLGVGATARASLYVYNDTDDVDALADALQQASDFFAFYDPQEPHRTMPGLEDLYREIILDHYRNPRNRGELDVPPAHRVEGFNPLCGDEIVVFLDVVDGEIVDLRIAGQGCSISQSSASMMSAAVKGKSVEEARNLTRSFKGMMSIHENTLEAEAEGPADDGSDVTGDGSTLGDLEALRGVVKFPVRIKCATLSWNTLTQGLDELAADT